MKNTIWSMILVMFLLMSCAKESTDSGLDEVWMRPTDNATMVYVPAGKFVMGNSKDDIKSMIQLCNELEYMDACDQIHSNEDESTPSVTLVGFWIDQTEVSNAQYIQCVEADKCSASPFVNDPDLNGNDHPVVGASWQDAKNYCEWAGGRLPTEAEWEYAARGPDGRIFPWGNVFDGAKLNYCDTRCTEEWNDKKFDDGYEKTAPVGSYPDGVSWCGALDMAGNALEWVADWRAWYSQEPQVNPKGPDLGEFKALRGGSWNSPSFFVRCASRFASYPTSNNNSMGFRCAKD